MYKFLIPLCLACSTMAAALPPLAESIEEYKALLELPELYNSFQKPNPIQKIKRVGNSFIITSNEEVVIADIEYLPLEQPGPSKFNITIRASNQ